MTDNMIIDYDLLTGIGIVCSNKNIFFCPANFLGSPTLTALITIVISSGAMI